MCDLSYLLWLDSIKYSFPSYLYSIADLFQGSFTKATALIQIYKVKLKEKYNSKKEVKNNNQDIQMGDKNFKQNEEIEVNIQVD